MKVTASELIKTLNATKGEERKKIIDHLSKFYPPIGLIVLLTLVNAETRWRITDRIEEVLQAEHSSLIIQLLSQEDLKERAYLAHAVGTRPDLALGEHLVHLVDDNDSFVRGLAIHALGKLRYEPVKEKIIARLNDKKRIYSNSDERVCDYSAIALVRIESQIPIKILDNLRMVPKYISEELIEINQSSPLALDDQFVNRLCEMLLLPEITESLAQSIVSLIGQFGSSKDAQVLIDYFVSRPSNRYEINSAVVRLADQSMTPKILSLLDKDDEGLQFLCLNVLSVHGDSTVVIRLLELIDELAQKENPYLTARAIEVLAIHGDPSVLEKVSSLERSKNESIRSSVVRAYGKFKDERSMGRILPFLEDENYGIRADAVNCLIEIGDPKCLEYILGRADFFHSYEEAKDFTLPLFHLNCVKAIRKFGNSDQINVLREIALKHKDADCRGTAICALEELQDERFIDLLIEKLSDEEFTYEYNESVSTVAARILNTIDADKAREALEIWLSKLPEDKKPDFTMDSGSN